MKQTLFSWRINLARLFFLSAILIIGIGLALGVFATRLLAAPPPPYSDDYLTLGPSLTQSVKEALSPFVAGVDDPAPVPLRIAAQTNAAPVIQGDDSLTLTVAENTTGTLHTFTAIDPDEGDTITWSLEDTDAALFAIDGGAVSPASGTVLDFEGTKTTYSFTVKASDGVDSDTVSVTVNVANLAEPPSAPGAPEITSATSNSMTVSWTAPSNTGPDIIDYDVRYCPTGGNCDAATGTGWTIFQPDTADDSTAISAIVTGLTPSTAYSVQVRAENDEGAGSWSDSATGNTGSPPLSFGSVTVAAQEWTVGTEITAVTLPEATGGTAPLTYSLTPALLGSGLSFDTSTRVLSGTPDTSQGTTAYTLTVTGSEGKTDNLSFNISIKPATPTLTLSPGNGQVTLIWTTANDPGIASWFYNQKPASKDDPGWGDGTEIEPSDSSTRSHIVTGLTNGVSYKFYVIAGTAEVAGTQYSEVQDTYPSATPTDLAVQTAPDFGSGTVSNQTYTFGQETSILKLPVATGGDGELIYSLSPDVADIGLTLRLSGLNPDRTPAPPDIRGTPTTSQPATTYTYKVSDNDGDQTASDEDTLTFTIAVKPAKPATPATTPAHERVTLTWIKSNDPGLEAYEVQQSTDSGVTWSQSTFSCLSLADSEAECTVTGLTNGIEYTFKIRAATGSGGDVLYGEASDGVKATPSDVAPDAPTDLTLTPGWKQLDASWTAPADNGGSDITGYDVRYCDTSGTCDTATASHWTDHVHDGTDAAAIITDLSNNVEYKVQVRAVNAIGAGDWAEDTATTLDCQDRWIWCATLTAASGDVSGTTFVGFKDFADDAAATDFGTLDPQSFDSDGMTYDVVSVLQATATAGSLKFELADSQMVSDLSAMTLHVGGVPADFTDATLSDEMADWTGLMVTIGAGSSYIVGIAPSNIAPVIQDAKTNGFILVTAEEHSTGDLYTFTATDSNNDTLAWSLGGTETEKASFRIDSSSGALSLAADAHLDHEGKPSYSFEVTVSDGEFTDTANVWFSVLDQESEPPLSPSAPTVTVPDPVSATTLDVEWTLDNTGRPVIDFYHLRYCPASGDCDNKTGVDWVVESTEETELVAVIEDLTADTDYEVQVRAENDHGTGPWSPSGTGTTSPNQAPVIAVHNTLTELGDQALSVQENTQFTRDFYAYDRDNGDLLTWSLDGSDAGSFSVDARTGILSLASGTSLDFESSTTSYSVTVKVSDDGGPTAAENLSDTVSVTVNVTDADEPPDVPATPTVTAASSSSLNVSWDAPDNTGRPAIDGYNVQYQESGAGSWTSHDDTAPTTSRSITGLDADTSYAVRVQTINHESDSDWSASGTATTEPASISAPGEPTELTLTSGNARLDAMWTAPTDNGGSDITGYDVEYCLSSTGCDADDWSDAGNTGIDTLHTIIELTNDVEYTVRVRTVTAAGRTSDWVEASASTDSSLLGFAWAMRDQRWVTGVGIRRVNLPEASGGTPSFDYGSLSASDGSDLPAGISYKRKFSWLDDSAILYMHGTPTASAPAKEYTYTVTESDSPAVTASLSFDIEVAPARPPRPDVTIGTEQVTLGWDAPDDAGITVWQVSLDGGATWDDLTVTQDTSVQPARLEAIVTGLTGVAYTFEIRAVSGSGSDVVWSEVSWPVTVWLVAGSTDYDVDDDGLIEVGSLAQLNAIRLDPKGFGAVGVMGDDQDAYLLAFPDPIEDMGCPTSEPIGSHPQLVDAGCFGYELMGDLDFDDNGDGVFDASDIFWNGGKGWEPIAGYKGVLEGNGHSIKGLYINRNEATAKYLGLFSKLEEFGAVMSLVLEDADIRGGNNVTAAGPLAGRNHGSAVRVQATGSMFANIDVWGGIVGENQGLVRESYASVMALNEGAVVGGLVGKNLSASEPPDDTNDDDVIEARIIASVAEICCVAVSGADGYAGGLAGENGGYIEASLAVPHFADLSGTEGGGTYGGLVGNDVSGEIVRSYFDQTVAGSGIRVVGAGTGTQTDAAGYSTETLQTPTGYTGIYAEWDLPDDFYTDYRGDAPLWNFLDAFNYPHPGWAAAPYILVNTRQMAVKEGSTSTYQVWLGGKPTETVTVNVSSVATAFVTVDPPTLIFTASDWNTPQDVTVTGVVTESTAPVTVGIKNEASGYDEVVVSVTSVESIAPWFKGAYLTIQAYDTTPSGAIFGEPVTATDENGDNLTYTLSGTDAGSFRIDAATGQLSLANNATLVPFADPTTPEYRITVTAEDTDSNTDSITVRVDAVECAGIWCATLTVGNAKSKYANNALGYGLSADERTAGKLLPSPVIATAGETYTITELTLDPDEGYLFMVLDPPMYGEGGGSPEDFEGFTFQFESGTNTFDAHAFSDPLRLSSYTEPIGWWFDLGNVSLEVGQTYDVKITGVSFGNQSLGGQSFTVGENIGTVTLPEAKGYPGPLTYRMLPNPALPDGLTIDGTSRVLTGTPTVSQGRTAHTYEAATAGSTATATLELKIGVAPEKAPTPTATGGAGQARLSWEKPTDSGISVWQATTDAGCLTENEDDECAWTGLTVSEVDSGGTAMLEGTLGELDGGTQYTVWIRALAGLGADAMLGEASEGVDVTPDDATAPGAPEGLNVTGTAAGTELKVWWTAPANDGGRRIAGYEVQCSDASADANDPCNRDMEDDGQTSKEWTVFGIVVPSVTSVTISGLDTEMEYRVRVRALNVQGVENREDVLGLSDWAEATGNTDQINAAPQITNAPASALSVAENENSGTSLHTFSATDADGDTITWSLSGTDAASFSIDDDGELTTAAVFDYEDANHGPEYTITVQASDGNGGADTVSVSVNITDADEPPSAPGAPTVTAASGSSLNVSWDAPDNTGKPAITGYNVQYQESGAGTWTAHDDTGPTTSRSITGLDADTSYAVQVQAINHEGSSNWSASGTATTEPAPVAAPGEPTGLTLTPGEGQIEVSWTAPVNAGSSDITGYDVHHCPTSTGCNEETDWTDVMHATTDTTVTIMNLDNMTEYQVRVRAVNADGSSNWVTENAETLGCPDYWFWCATLTAGSDDIDGTTVIGFNDFADSATADIGSLDSLSFDYDDSTYNVVSLLLVGTDSLQFNLADTEKVSGLQYLTLYVNDNTFGFNDASRSGEVAEWSLVALTLADGSSYTVGIAPSLPAAPYQPMLTSGNAELEVVWSEPWPDGGSPITDYDVRYCDASSSTCDSDTDSHWTDHTDAYTIGADSRITTSITGLTNDQEYHVQVRAENAAGEGPWSESSIATPSANQPPYIIGSGGRSIILVVVMENTTGVITTFSAGDPNGDSISWTISGGDSALFTIADKAGTTNKTELSTAASTTLDYDSDKTIYEFFLRANDGNGGEASVRVRMSVWSQAPAAPAAPSVTAASQSSLNVSWSAPDIGTSPLQRLAATDYDLRYCPTGGDCDNETGADWSDYDHTGTTTSATITGLSSDTSYDVQVRASNEEGDGPWSPSGTGKTNVGTGCPAGWHLCATLTVGSGDVSGTTVTGFKDFADSATTDIGSLDPSSFDYSGSTYTVVSLLLEGAGALKFELDGTQMVNDLDTLTLHVGDVPAKFADATQSDQTADWTGIALTLTDGNTYRVGIAPNSAPEITNAPASGLSVAENEDSGTSLYTFTATDADGDTITWSLDGTDAALFSIDATTGELTTAAELDYEAKEDAAGSIDPTRSITVQASDGSNTGTVDVTVTVTDVRFDLDVANDYDANNNERIELSEVYNAIDDLIDGDLLLSELYGIIDVFIKTN